MHRRARTGWIAAVTVGLGLAAPGSGWGWTPRPGVALPGVEEAVRVVVGDWQGRSVVAVTGSGGTAVLDRSGQQLATVGVSAHDLLLHDHDGDGQGDLVLCGPAGVSWLPGGGGDLVTLDGASCRALAAFDGAEGGRRLLTVGSRATVWTLAEGGALVEPVELEGVAVDEPLTATDGQRMALGSEGQREVVEYSAWGRSVYRAPSGIGGLAVGPRSWVWSLPSEGFLEDVTRARVPVADDPGVLRRGRLEGGQSALLVLHPMSLGVVAGGEETLHGLAAPVRDLAVGDLDGDGCGDIVLIEEPDGQVVRRDGVCGAAERAVAAAAELQTLQVVLDRPERRVQAVAGRPLDIQFVDPEGVATGFSGRGGPEGLLVEPEGHVAWRPTAEDVGEHTIAVRMWGGEDVVRVVPVRVVVAPGDPDLDTLKRGDDGLRRLVLSGQRWPDLRVPLGGAVQFRLVDPAGQTERWVLRGEPAGMQVDATGVITYEPRAEDLGEWQVEVRLVGDDTRKWGFGLRVVPSERPRRFDDAPAGRTNARSAAAGESQGFWRVHHCQFGVGVAAGVSDGSASWRLVGQSGVYYSASPALAGLCEGGRVRGLKWFAGGDTAPVFAYFLRDDQIGVHTLVGTAGLAWGGERAEIGPFAAMGILMSAFGVRAAWLPFESKVGRAHGFEVRGTWLIANRPAVEVMALYVFRFGNRRRSGSGSP